MSKFLTRVSALVFSAAFLCAAQQAPPPSEELITYIQSARKAGIKPPQIQENAEKAGWPADVVKHALDLSMAPAAVAATPAVATAPVTHETTVTPPVTTTAPAVSTAGPAANTAAPAANTAPAAAEPAGNIAKPAVNRGVPDEYQIGGGDVISINVWGEPSASAPSVMVRPDGKISMPLVKEVFVAGLTPTQLEKTITDQLSDKIRAADVTVVVNQVNSKKVFLLGGGVKKEGPISFSYGMTVMQALSEAGGLSDYAKRKKIYVLRNQGGRQFKLPFDYDAVLQGQRMELNYPLVPGDIVVAPNH